MPEIKSNSDFVFYVMTLIYLYVINDLYQGWNYGEFYSDQCINETVVDQNVCLPKKSKIIKRQSIIKISKYLNKVYKILFGDSVEYTEILVYITIYFMVKKLVFEPIIDYIKNLFGIMEKRKEEKAAENEKRGFNHFFLTLRTKTLPLKLLE